MTHHQEKHGHKKRKEYTNDERAKGIYEALQSEFREDKFKWSFEEVNTKTIYEKYALSFCEKCLYYSVNMLFFFITIFTGIYKIEPMQASIFTVFGKVI